MLRKTHKHEEIVCGSKSRFKTEGEAKASALKSSRKHKDKRARTYFCQSCKGWHLTTIKR